MPGHDVWYLDAPRELPHCTVMTRADYLAHPTYRDIRYVNAYLHWQMPPTVTSLAVSHGDLLSLLPTTERTHLLELQVEHKRGLVFPRSHFDDVPASLTPCVVGDRVVLTHAGWDRLDEAVQWTALRREQRIWDDCMGLPVPGETPPLIATRTNGFLLEEGTNCLATTAWCLSRDDALASGWMFPEAFHAVLHAHGYAPTTSTEPTANDVIVFEQDGATIHAAYCVVPDRFVSKNGQSRFNPVRMVDWSALLADWPHATHTIHRRTSPYNGVIS